MPRTVRAHLDRQAAERCDATYLIAAETGRSMTFGQLLAGSRRLAQFLSLRGARPGAKIAVLMPNGFQTTRLLIGIMYGGFCATPLNLLAQPAQLAYVLEHCDADIVFVSPDQLERLRVAAAPSSRRIDIIVCDADGEEFIAERHGAANPPPVAQLDAALLVYTSGTTGTPKGVVLANRAVVAGGEFVSRAHELTGEDRVMAALPLCHINALIVTMMAPLIHGGSCVMAQRFRASSFWETVAEHRCTWINVVPTIIAYLLQGTTPTEAGLDVSRVRFCRSASAPLALIHHRAFEQQFGIGIIETMGLTETAAPCFSNPIDPVQRKIGSPGKAFGNRARIVDAEGGVLPPGSAGEIMIAGDNVMSCYYKDASETAKTLTPDGWLHTGDLGYLDEDGFVFVTGRIKELIIKGGENIAPREVDEALLKHPAVNDAAAVGIPDALYGQEIMACVVLRAGGVCTEVELREHCRRELGSYKTPKVFIFVEDLPRGPSGKVQRLKLLDRLPAV